MSKLQSILFDADEGPASSLLRQGDSNSNGTGDRKSDNVNENPKIIITPQEQQSQAISDRRYHQRIDTTETTAAVLTSRTTTFSTLVGSNISPSSALSPQSVLSDDHSISLSQQLQHQGNSSTIRKLREQVQTLQNEVTEERTLRKRKEKSILKLAKELTSRSIIEHQSHQKMEELQETIQDLEHRLLERNRTIQTTLPQLQIQNEQLNQTLHSYQKEIQILQQQQQMIQSRERSIQKSSQMVMLMQPPTQPSQPNQNIANATTESIPVPSVTKIRSTVTSCAEDHTEDHKNEGIEETQLYSPSLLGDLSEQSTTTTTVTTTTGGCDNHNRTRPIIQATNTMGNSDLHVSMAAPVSISSTTNVRTTTATSTTSHKSHNNNSSRILWNNAVVLLLIVGVLLVISNYSIWIQWQQHYLWLSPATEENTTTTHHVTPKRRISATIMDGICAPVRPGTIWTTGGRDIASSSGTGTDVVAYEAPWWVPSSFWLSTITPPLKDYIFNRICTSRQRTRIEINHNSMIHIWISQ